MKTINNYFLALVYVATMFIILDTTNHLINPNQKISPPQIIKTIPAWPEEKNIDFAFNPHPVIMIVLDGFESIQDEQKFDQLKGQFAKCIQSLPADFVIGCVASGEKGNQVISEIGEKRIALLGVVTEKEKTGKPKLVDSVYLSYELLANFLLKQETFNQYYIFVIRGTDTRIDPEFENVVKHVARTPVKLVTVDFGLSKGYTSDTSVQFQSIEGFGQFLAGVKKNFIDEK